MFKKLSLLFIIVSVLVTTNLVSAAWTDPPLDSPPTCPSGYPGCDAPINVSSIAQLKQGSFGILGFLAPLGKLFVANDPLAVSPDSFRLASTIGYDASFVFKAQGNIGAEKYCDENGLNCKAITVLGGGGGTYVGATAATYDGAGIGGYVGGDAKCAATFPGSRMATAADFANGRPTEIGWFNSFVYSVMSSPSTYDDCRGWTQGTNSYGGQVWFPPSSKSVTSCNGSYKILCSTSGTGGGPASGITSLTAGAGITLTPNPITTTGTIAANPSVSGDSVMYLRISTLPSPAQVPTLCPAANGWTQADLQLENAGTNGPTGVAMYNNTRTCYTNLDCKVMYLRKAYTVGNEPALCPGTWTMADIRSEVAGGSEDAFGIVRPTYNWVRTCYKCN